jgi:hypothetical protein
MISYKERASRINGTPPQYFNENFKFKIPNFKRCLEIWNLKYEIFVFNECKTSPDISAKAIQRQPPNIRGGRKKCEFPP